MTPHAKFGRCGTTGRGSAKMANLGLLLVLFFVLFASRPDHTVGLITTNEGLKGVVAVVVVVYHVSNNSQNCFRHDVVKFLPTLTNFGLKMAKVIELGKMHSFSTSPNFCERTTV